MERKSKGTIAYKMKGTAVNPDATAKKPKWYNVAEKLKVRRMNKRAEKKFNQ